MRDRGRRAVSRADAWLGFAYVALVSMFLGFFAWYRGLALGGIARIGQIQLAQPVLTLVWAALLLGEQVTLRPSPRRSPCSPASGSRSGRG